jgi:hypothetical protein
MSRAARFGRGKAQTFHRVGAIDLLAALQPGTKQLAIVLDI